MFPAVVVTSLGMTLVVAATFASSLDSRVESLHDSPAVTTALDAQRSRLLDASLRAGLPPNERAELQKALKEAFVSGFRTSTLIGAALAAASTLLTAGLINGKRPEETVQRRDQRAELPG